MRIFLFLLLVFLPVLTGAQSMPEEEPEIIIELTGEPDPVTDGISLWDKTERQLSQLFQNKTRQDVLYLVESVSTADSSLQSSSGKKYRYVRYGRDDGEYRKFLFDYKDRFLACADNAASVLILNQTYGINLGVSEEDFLDNFPQATPANLFDFPNEQELQSYQIALSPQNAPCHFLFVNGKLSQTFPDEKTYTRYVNELSEKNQQWLEEEHLKQQKQLEQLQQEKEDAIRRAQYRNRPFKALIKGGTWEDRLFMPRVLNPGKYELGPMVPNGTIPGTPIIRQ